MLKLHFIWFCAILLFWFGDVEAKIKRSQSARHAFMASTICPSTGKKSSKCPGYIVDHVCALAVGGWDKPINMQYQTEEDSRNKDRIERTPMGVALYCTPKNRRTKP